MQEILSKSVSVGINAFKAMSIQVINLMWLRTIMNYQYKNGGKFTDIARKLYKEGGILRFYSGLLPALILGPLCRFVDTFSNAIILNFFSTFNLTIPIFLKTGIASVTAAFIRMVITPIDTLKTMKQVQGNKALEIIKNKIKSKGLIGLYDGAVTNFILVLFGHYPWFVVHNYLNKYIPIFEDKIHNLLRNASIGFISSCISDVISNSVHVLKISKQTGDKNKSYFEIFMEIKDKEGLLGFFLRGLSSKLIINGIQGLLFNTLWKYFNGNEKEKKEKNEAKNKKE